MNRKDIAIGTIIFLIAVVLLSYSEQNHVALGKMISMGILGLIIGSGFFLHGLLSNESLA